MSIIMGPLGGLDDSTITMAAEAQKQQDALDLDAARAENALNRQMALAQARARMDNDASEASGASEASDVSDDNAPNRVVVTAKGPVPISEDDHYDPHVSLAYGGVPISRNVSRNASPDGSPNGKSFNYSDLGVSNGTYSPITAKGVAATLNGRGAENIAARIDVIERQIADQKANSDAQVLGSDGTPIDGVISMGTSRSGVDPDLLRERDNLTAILGQYYNQAGGGGMQGLINMLVRTPDYAFEQIGRAAGHAATQTGTDVLNFLLRHPPQIGPGDLPDLGSGMPPPTAGAVATGTRALSRFLPMAPPDVRLGTDPNAIQMGGSDEDPMDPTLPDGGKLGELGSGANTNGSTATGTSVIGSPQFQELVDQFASLPGARAYKKWKNDLLNAGVDSSTIAELVHHGSLQRGENLWGNNWKRYLEEISNTEFPGDPYHAHHLAEKEGLSDAAALNRQILREVGIDPYLSGDNLTWAPNVVGQHGSVPQGQLLEKLMPVRGDQAGIKDVLNQWATTSKAR